MKQFPLNTSIREIIFGLEDGIVSTMGVITGIASGTKDQFTVIVAGLVVVSVESISMAAGTYLSNKTEEEIIARKHKYRFWRNISRQAAKHAERDALAMGVSYVIGGSLPIIPYLFLPLIVGIYFSIIMPIFGLTVVGIWKASLTGENKLKSVVETTGVSLVAALTGFIIGKLVGYVYPQVSNTL